VTISGTTTQGQVLSADNILSDPDGIGSIQYQWQSSSGSGNTWSNISGATASTFMLTQGQVSKNVRVLDSYTDGKGMRESVPNAATASIANATDWNVGTAALSGNAVQYATLTAPIEISPAVARARIALDVAQLETQKARTGHRPTVDLSAGITHGREASAGRGHRRGQPALQASGHANARNVAITLKVPIDAPDGSHWLRPARGSSRRRPLTRRMDQRQHPNHLLGFVNLIDGAIALVRDQLARACNLPRLAEQREVGKATGGSA
jgi:hypothetical protein